MNTPDFTSDKTSSPSPERPLGYWLRAVDHSIKRSMHDALTEDGLGRRAWRILSVIEAGASNVAEIDAALRRRRRGGRGPKGFDPRRGFGPGRGFGRADDPERSTDASVGVDTEHPEHDHRHPEHDRGFGRGRGAGQDGPFGRGAGRGMPFGPGFDRGFGGGPFGPGHHGHGPRGRRRSTEELVMDFAARGWVTVSAEGITLTDAGREAHAALRTKVDAVRQTVVDAVSPEDLATTLASLESIARAFGWEEASAAEHGPRGRFGRGPRGHHNGSGHRAGRRDHAERCEHDGHGERAQRPEAPTGTTPDDAR